MTLLNIQNLTLRFRSAATKEPAVRDVSFSVNAGEVFALVGESGSGKSVTALSILQLLDPQAVDYPSGSIRFENEELLGAGKATLHEVRGGKIGIIFQEPMTSLNPLHPIGKQIAEMVSEHQSLTKAQTTERVQELLAKVGLEHFKNRLGAYPHQLSGGERQRVMIAMAIANNPALLIADEPTTALDVSLQNTIIDLLDDLRRSMGMAVLLITHDLPLVHRIADRVAVMQRGAIVEQGSTEQVFSAAKHPYTQHLMTCAPKGNMPPLPADTPALLSCENLAVHFPVKKGFFGQVREVKKAVDDMSFHVCKGETLGIVGESGSGKTTLGLALLRLIGHQKGRVCFDGNDLFSLPQAPLRHLRKRLQFVFQDPFSSLNPRMSIGDIVTEGLNVHFPELVPEERRARTVQILNDVELDEAMLTRYPHEFSGGQRQRIAIARAMILQPELVVLDEPTSALDLSLQAQIIELLKALQQKYHTSYLFISHDLRVIRALSHRVIVLKGGRIVEEGDTNTLFSSPQHPYTKTLIMDAFGPAA